MKILFAVLAISLLLLGCTSVPQEAQQGANASAGANVSYTNKTGEQMNNNTASKPNGIFAKKGDVVSVDYVGTLQNGTLFDTSMEAEAAKGGIALRDSYEPLSFTVGGGEMIAGFDNAVVGMKINETKTITFQPAQAYGEMDKTRILAVPIANIQSDGRNVTIGGFVYTPSGARGIISGINGTDALIDFNHPLAGKTLIFTITVRSIKNP